MGFKVKRGNGLATVGVAALAASLVVGGSGPVGASGATAPGGTWGLSQPLPGLAALTTTNGSLPNGPIGAITCTTPGNCVAVGYTVTGSGGTAIDAPIVATETAGTWGNVQTVSGAASLGSGAGARLVHVSCGAAGGCTATGTYSGTDGRAHALYVSETAGVWSTVVAVSEAGQPAGTYSTINGVSCPAAGYCAVVGDYTTPSTTKLACASAGNCVLADTAGIETAPNAAHRAAVADSETSSGDWGTLTAIAVPASTAIGAVTLSYASEVSCAPGGDCTIVGYYDTAASTPFDMFAATSTGGVLGNEQSVIPATFSSPAIVGLACPQSGYCTLVYNMKGAPEVVTEATAATVRLTTSAPTVTYGSEPVETFTATVSSPVTGTPTGAVTVTGPGGGTLCTLTPSGGTGNCSDAAPALPGGTDTLRATYSGDATYVVASGTATVTVNRATSTTSLGISPTSATFSGKDITVTSSTSVTSAAGTPAGTVDVEINSKKLASCEVQVLTAGKDTCTSLTWVQTPGRYAFTVGYSGNADFAPSTSAVHYLTVSKARTTTTLTLSRATVTYGHESAERLTVSVSHVGSVYSTGKVAVRIGGATICTITLNRGTGSCTLGNTRLRAGAYRFVAVYPGNGDYGASTSASKALKVAA